MTSVRLLRFSEARAPGAVAVAAAAAACVALFAVARNLPWEPLSALGT